MVVKAVGTTIIRGKAIIGPIIIPGTKAKAKVRAKTVEKVLGKVIKAVLTVVTTATGVGSAESRRSKTKFLAKQRRTAKLDQKNDSDEIAEK
jgi:hypothetical protein